MVKFFHPLIFVRNQLVMIIEHDQQILRLIPTYKHSHPTSSAAIRASKLQSHILGRFTESSYSTIDNFEYSSNRIG